MRLVLVFRVKSTQVEYNCWISVESEIVCVKRIGKEIKADSMYCNM